MPNRKKHETDVRNEIAGAKAAIGGVYLRAGFESERPMEDRPGAAHAAGCALCLAGMRPDPRRPDRHIDPKTGIWPADEWGNECGRALRQPESKTKKTKPSEKMPKRSACEAGTVSQHHR
jgi:hypothetical protein